MCGDFSEGHSRPLSQTALVLAPQNCASPSCSDRQTALQAHLLCPTSGSSHLLFPGPGIPSPLCAPNSYSCFRAQFRCHLLQPVECLLPSNFPQSGIVETPVPHPRGTPPLSYTHTPKVELAGLTPCLGWRVCMPREAPGEGSVPGHPRWKFRPRDPLSGEGEAGRSSAQAAGVAKEAPVPCFVVTLELIPGARPDQPAWRAPFPGDTGPWEPAQGKWPLPVPRGTHWPQGLGCGGRGQPGGSRRSGPRTGVSPPLRLREEESHGLGSGAQPVPRGNGSEESQGW